MPPASNGARTALGSAPSEQMCQGAVANEAKYDDVSTAAVGDDSEMLAGCGPLSPEAVYNVSMSRLLARD